MSDLWRQNVSGKRQVLSRWPESTVVDPNCWARDEVVKDHISGTFSEPQELPTSGFSYLIEKQDAHGNVVRVLVRATGVPPVRPAASPASAPVSGRLLFSVVVPAYGQHEHLHACLAGVLGTDGPSFEVVVVDDKPGDPVSQLPEGVRLVRNTENLGFAGACNAGARAAKGDWIVFLNSDTVPRGDWLLDMLSTARRMMAGIVGARLLYPHNERTQHAGMFPHGRLYRHERKNLPKNHQDVSVDRHLHAVSGACMMVERKVWELLGGFDEEFGKGYFEDVDLCLRHLAVGGRVAYCGSTEVLHHESTSQGKRTKAWKERLARSAGVFKKKWSPQRLEKVTRGYPWAPKVDIVMAVHDAARQSADCLDSVVARTPGWIDWRLFVVDDASDDFTVQMLVGRCRNHPRLRYVRSDENRGYLPSIQAGTDASDAPWLCYLNSDVVVTDGWLPRMLAATEADERIKIVNPLTNRAAHVSVPMPPGSNYVDTDERVSRSPGRDVFDVVTPVGFCMLVERRALEECGGWDVGYYGRGYGEECDLYMRMVERGHRSVVADGCYVLHEGGATFSQFGSQKAQEKAGYDRFMSRWGPRIQPMLNRFNRESPQRAALPAAMAVPTRRRSVVFLFPNNVTLCGGVLSTVHICNRLIELGWNATFACTQIARNVLDRLGARFSPRVFSSRAELINGVRKETRDGFVVATIWSSAHDAVKICNGRHNLRPVYFVQDVEYLFRYPTGKLYSNEAEVVETYGMIDRKVVNSDWVLSTVRGHLGDQGAGHKIGIGVDPLVFYPRTRDERVRVAAHCRPSTPRRGWDLVSRVLTEMKRRHGERVELVVYDQDPGRVPVDVRLGQVSPPELARWMGSTHVFVEGSKFQGFGMQSLEAMASGCALVSTDNLGIDNYGTHEHDCVVVPQGDEANMADVVSSLVENRGERERLGKNARTTAVYFDWKHVADEWDHYLRSSA